MLQKHGELEDFISFFFFFTLFDIIAHHRSEQTPPFYFFSSFFAHRCTSKDGDPIPRIGSSRSNPGQRVPPFVFSFFFYPDLILFFSLLSFSVIILF